MPKTILAKKPFNIILLGDPAAGKATQSSILIKRYPLVDFDMGRELNKRRQADKNLDLLLKSNTDKGKLTPTRVIRKILKETIKSTPQDKGILFDGTPKMLGEARLVALALKEEGRSNPLVLYVSVPFSETMSRMRLRKGYFTGKFGKRPDDTDVALKNRVRYYRTNIAQVVNFFELKYRFKKINGVGTVRQVAQRLEVEIKKFQAIQKKYD